MKKSRLLRGVGATFFALVVLVQKNAKKIGHSRRAAVLARGMLLYVLQSL